MTVRLTEDGAIEVSGRCGVEDAESLQGYLLAAPESTVEWSACEHLHSAVLQVLLIARPHMRGAPRSAFLRTHVEPLLRSSPG
jgi:hypothetical protein